MPESARYVSPPAYAKRLGVDPIKVLAWIKRGELRAINVATATTGRPRYRIPLDAICEFEQRRSETATTKAAKRKKNHRDDSFIKYF